MRILTVADRFLDRADAICAELRQEMVRAEVDRSGERMGKLIRNAAGQKIPNVLVIGEREVEEGTVTLRRHGSREQHSMPMAEFKTRLLEAIRTRSKEL